MEVTFVRHGQSEANAALSENPDSVLTEIGRRQAEAVGQRLKNEGFADNGHSYLLTSPLIRTLMTSTLIYDATRMPATLFPDVCEFFSDRHAAKFGRFEGLSLDAITTQYPFVTLDPSLRCSEQWWPRDLETDATLYSRAVRVRDLLLSRYRNPEDRVVIVSHADPIGRLIEAFLRVPPEKGAPAWTDNASVSRARADGADRPAELVLLNDTSHLDTLGISTPSKP